MKTLIEVKNVSKKFEVMEKECGGINSLRALFKKNTKEVLAVNDISFNINKGERVAFIGPNGAGKSTTIKMLTGILAQDEGKILINGYEPQKDTSKIAQNIGTVFGQKEQLWMNLTPYDNFNYLSIVYSVPREIVKKTISDYIDIFELKDIIHTPVKNLSLGQRMRCEIVAGLIHKPEILFLDEPTIGLDPVVKNNIIDLLKNMNQLYGTTLFFTSHDVSDIEKLCERVIIVNNGEIVLDDTVDNLKKNYFKKKKIELTLKNNINEDVVEQFQMELIRDNLYEFEIESDKLNVEEILKVIGFSNILDINIQDLPLESVISDIYTYQ